MQRFTDVNVAEAGDEALVEQRSFQWRRLAGEKPREERAIELVAERLDSHSGKERMPVEPNARNDQHEAEPAWIVIDDAGTVRHAEHDMVVRGSSRSCVMKLSRAPRSGLHLDAE